MSVRKLVDELHELERTGREGDYKTRAETAEQLKSVRRKLGLNPVTGSPDRDEYLNRLIEEDEA